MFTWAVLLRKMDVVVCCLCVLFSRFIDNHGNIFLDICLTNLDMRGLVTVGRFSAIYIWETTFMTCCLLSCTTITF